MRLILLLRGINVGGRNLVPMAELRALASGLGWLGARTYLQSGNLVVTARATNRAAERALEEVLEERFGRSIPVLVRTAAQWSRYVAGNPFPAEAEAEPNRVILTLCKTPPSPGAEQALRAAAAPGERVALEGDAIWLYYGSGFAASRLVPGYLDRVAGSAVTTRNWRTVLALDRLAAG